MKEKFTGWVLDWCHLFVCFFLFLKNLKYGFQVGSKFGQEIGVWKMFEMDIQQRFLLVSCATSIQGTDDLGMFGYVPQR